MDFFFLPFGTVTIRIDDETHENLLSCPRLYWIYRLWEEKMISINYFDIIRDYASDWAVDGNKLYLTGWIGYLSNYQQINMNDLFPGETFVFASWFTGHFAVNLGKKIVNPQNDVSTYEGLIIISVKDGIIYKHSKKIYTEEEIKDRIFWD